MNGKRLFFPFACINIFCISLFKKATFMWCTMKNKEAQSSGLGPWRSKFFFLFNLQLLWKNCNSVSPNNRWFFFNRKRAPERDIPLIRRISPFIGNVAGTPKNPPKYVQLFSQRIRSESPYNAKFIVPSMY